VCDEYVVQRKRVVIKNICFMDVSVECVNIIIVILP
jgi:hypothetical protein